MPREIIHKAPQPGVQPDNEENDLEACVSELEIRLINQALQKAAGNKAKAARILKISERTLWYKLKKYNVETSNYAED